MLKCGSAEVNNAMLANPDKLAIHEQLEREYLEYRENEDGTRSVVRIIPVVFHIIHNNGVENISKDQVLSALQIINNDFRKLNADASSVHPNFIGIAADSEIEFRLAKLDPNGNCTDGITRTVSALTYTAGDNVKDLIRWTYNRYLNIWVVDNIESGAAGYAYYPGNAPGNGYEGIVIQHRYVGNIGTSNGSNYSSRSLTHEIGHYMNLAHTWGNSNEVAVATNCNMDDGVSDTPNTIGTNQTCNLNQNTCGSLDNVENYMDYSTCTKMFTNGQKTRMQSALNSSAGGRNNLWTSANLAQTGTSNGFTSVCTPQVAFSANKQMGCTGLSVTFTDQSWGADQDATWQWNWSFPGATPSTSTQQNPTVVYNTAGTFNVSLTITTGAGSNNHSKTSYINILSPTQAGNVPYDEGVENTTFPNHPSDNSRNWSVSPTGAVQWSRTTQAAATGAASVRVNLRSAASGNMYNLISPSFNLSQVSSAEAKVTFKVAHAMRESGSDERLRMYVSKNCGETWSVRYNKNGSQLATNGGSLVTGTFVPSASQWRTETVSLSLVAGEPHVMLRFEATSAQQNNLYLDDINIFGSTVGIEESSLAEGGTSIFPNPVIDDAELRVNMNRAEMVKVEVLDLNGKLLMSKNYQLEAGENIISIGTITQNLAQGAYVARVVTTEFAQPVRFVKQ